MDDATFTSDAAAINRHKLLEQLAIIRSLFRQESSADDADAATAAARNRNVVEDRAREGVRLIHDQMTAVSTELLLTVMSDMMLLRLLDGLRLEEGRAVASDASSSDEQQLMDDAAAKKKKKKRAAAAAKKRRYKRNKAAAKHKQTKLMSWLSGGIISVIMMVAFSFITTPIVTLSLIQPSDGLGEGKAPPVLPPSASNPFRQEDIKPNDEASTSPGNIISPLAAVVPPPIFAPIALSNRRRRKKSDEMRASTCFDTPNWEDVNGYGCDIYEECEWEEPGCPDTDIYAGDKGPAIKNCCICGGGSHSRPPTNSPTTNSPSISANPSSSSRPSSSPSKSANPSSSTAPSMCTDTEGWYDKGGYDCVWYEVMDVPGCPKYGDLYKEWNQTKGVANENCCYCKNAIVSTPSSASAACVDTPGWEDKYGNTCDAYENEFDLDPGCPDTDFLAGDSGPASKHCCHCKNPSCEDVRSRCQENTINMSFLSSFCAIAASSCCEAADHDVKIVTVTNVNDRILSWNETVGLYNECKCDFWLRLCEDTGTGEACDYAAEYCCGDYKYEDSWGFNFLNSPTCYCDFFNYAQNEFGHTLKSKALNVSKEFNNPCGQLLQGSVAKLKLEGEGADFIREYERPSLEAIYNETDGQNWTNSAGWMNETVDHCQWYGITCDVDGFVTNIDLRNNNLVGQFPVYSRNEFNGDFYLESEWIVTKYGLANLYNLKSLDLADNKLTGTIDYRPLYDLHLLTQFDISGNQFSGEIDALVTPSLTYADFSKNRFTSMRRFEKYKVSPFQTLRFCDVSMNAIKNEATDFLENIPPNIERLFASNNAIYGSLPKSLNDLPKLRQFDLSSNALFGNLPGFTESFATLQELDMSNQPNGFTGSIPENIWRSLSLKILNLADNRLTGPIPSLVGNLAVLEEFDLTNNLVQGSIPSELGMLDGSLKHLRLSNNMFTGSIPSEIGRLQGASVFLKLKENNFYNSSKTAPLGLCTLRNVKEFDLVNDTALCPVERNALSDFYDSTKGAEWTDSTNWLNEFKSCCNWHGVTCNEDKTHVTNLILTNNGLSGRLRESLGHLTFMEVLDLSDNDIKGSIPTEIGQLTELTYLRLSYNAFTGTAECLEELTKLRLLQLQSNRINGMPNITQLDKSEYNESTFVTDCGVPSAFDETPECKVCTMCCNANDDCYPQEKTNIANFGYSNFAAVFFACFIVICCVIAFSLYLFGKRKNRVNAITMSAERRLEEDDTYALSKIGKESVYSYFVTEKPVGWLAAFATLGIQVGFLMFFVMASEANLQEDTIDIEFTWKCPRDSDVCEDKADLTKAGWIIFSLLMIAFLAKDMINGCKLIYHSSKVSHTLGSRIRYFIGGMCLCSITLFAFYVSTVYNSAIATSNTAIIANSVIVLFIMEIDEYIFSAVDAINDKWTEHAADTKVSDMEKEIARQRAQIESQQGEIESQQEEIDNQRKDLGMLREAVEKIQESQAAASASDSESAECEGNTGAQLMEQVDQSTMPSVAEQNKKEFTAAAAAATSSRTVTQCTAHESTTSSEI